MAQTFLAVDFGGSSGRVIAGCVIDSDKGKVLRMEELYRFANKPLKRGEYLYWDFPTLLKEMKTGLKKAAELGLEVASIGIDTWGVDFGLIDEKGKLLGLPYCYRDPHSQITHEKFFKQHDADAHYAESGIQQLSINTIFRLMWMAENDNEIMRNAARLLFMPDLFSYCLCGSTDNEFTIASTSELLDARSGNWNWGLIDSLGFNPSLFGKIVMPGTVRGTLSEEIARETGLDTNVKVIAVASHDTASAEFACRENYYDDRAAFLSSGTWSLIGVELVEPILTQEARKDDLTNEGGAGGTTLLMKNITGLWLLERLRDQWRDADKEIGWNHLIEEGERSEFTDTVDVEDSLLHGDMPIEEGIAEYCRRHGHAVPRSQGDYVACICRSLAECYKKAVDNLNGLLPLPIERIRIIGGGSNNRLLNRLTREATGLEVLTGPAEATAIGNILLQAVASGIIADKKEITEIVYGKDR